LPSISFHEDGQDLRRTPLSERRAALRKLIERDPRSPVHFSDHVDCDGAKFFKAAAELGLEGIVSKRATSLYRGGPSRNLLKTKNMVEGESGMLPDLPMRDGRTMEPMAETVDKLPQVPERIKQAIPGYEYLRNFDAIWESLLQQGTTERRQQQIVNQNDKGEPAVIAAAPAVNSLDLFKILIDGLNAMLGVAGLVLGLCSVTGKFKDRRAASEGAHSNMAESFHHL
jgi:hypothetical protein